ncbi:hypothetical protein C8Q78DRAFT_732380 [Trametes maxima]|nr:hypothetical protein C8Q78DRAFT_732380 [Trametes maxima]
MRLLNTRSGAFRWFERTADVSYAIVSQVVGEGKDQSYQDILRVQNAAAFTLEGHASKHCLQNSSILDDARVSPTIRRACQLAAGAGYDYVWISSCCVDRTNDVELARTLSDLWDWYSRAGLCYAYLGDVSPVNEDGAASFLECNQFRESEWHKDPWTLLALCAPPNVVFLAQDWSVLGAKASLATTIEVLTGIDKEILRGEKCLHDASIARRMWWASKRRKPVAEEDLAYSLLGLFNVRMPILYGEGPRAFLRLQEEILRTTDDQSIFAWHYHQGHDHPDSLLAFAPCCFARSGDIELLHRNDFLSRLGLPASSRLSSPLLTTSGLSAALPLIPHEITSYPPTTALYEVFGVAARFSDVAVLQCKDVCGRLVVLTLDRAQGAQSKAERHVKAVETTLGQRDRVWGYEPVLYRQAVEVQEVHISRIPLVAPWFSRDVRVDLGANTSGGRGVGETLVALEEGCRLALEKRGFAVSYETAQQEIVDDLYERNRRARRLADVHRFGVIKSLPHADPKTAGLEHVVTVEVTMRRFCLAPPTLNNVKVFFHSDRGSVEGSTLQESLMGAYIGMQDSCVLKAEYPVQDKSRHKWILSLVLSKLHGPDPIYSLGVQMDDLKENTDSPSARGSSSHAQLECRRPWPEGIPTQSAKNGKVMDEFPRLPDIRGWTSRGVGHIARDSTR